MEIYGSKGSFFRMIERAVAKGGSCPVLEGLGGEIPPRYSTTILLLSGSQNTVGIVPLPAFCLLLWR